jgi:hypothetical protein
LEDPGATTTLETLCSHQPQDVDDVKEKLRAVAAMMAFLGLTPGTAAAGVTGPNGAEDTEEPDTNAERATDAVDGGHSIARPGTRNERLRELTRGGTGEVFVMHDEVVARDVVSKEIQDQRTERDATMGDARRAEGTEPVPNHGGDGARQPFTETHSLLKSTGGEKQFGRYWLSRLLGEGAFGRVYLGFDEELKRRVAIKVPTPERFQAPRDADLYLAEARTVATLDHPNIVPVYDVGRTADGSIYVVSKFIEGPTLRDRIEQRPSADEASRLVAIVARALDHAHRRMAGLPKHPAAHCPEGLDEAPAEDDAAGGQVSRSSSGATAPGSEPGRRAENRESRTPAPQAHGAALAAEFSVIRDALAEYQKDLSARLWSDAKSGENEGRRFRAACALATYEPLHPDWRGIRDDVVQSLTRVKPEFLDDWKETLRGVRGELLDPLGVVFRDHELGELQQALATSTLADYAAGDVGLLADLLADATPRQFAELFPVLAQHGEAAIGALERELAIVLKPDWADAPPDPPWKDITAEVRLAIEGAVGLVEERFALCQSS